MDLIEIIKEFLKTKSLNWTGYISTHKDEDFRPAKIEDFEHLSNADYLIDFGEDGQMALSIEVDDITFKIYGESYDVGFSCYAGDNEKNIKLIQKIEDKDLSEKFIKFQLETCGLVRARYIIKRSQEEQQKIKAKHETIRTKKAKKIKFLKQGIQNDKIFEKEELKEFLKIERMAKKYEDNENIEQNIEV